MVQSATIVVHTIVCAILSDLGAEQLDKGFTYTKRHGNIRLFMMVLVVVNKAHFMLSRLPYIFPDGLKANAKAFINMVGHHQTYDL